MTRHPERPVVDAHQHSRDARNSLPRLCDPQPIWFRHRNYDALRLFSRALLGTTVVSGPRLAGWPHRVDLRQ